MQELSITSTDKYSQTSKSALHDFFQHCELEKLSKIRDTPPPLMYKIFRNQKLSEIPKGPPTKTFGTLVQKLRNFSVILPSIVYSNIRKQMRSADFELYTSCLL